MLQPCKSNMTRNKCSQELKILSHKIPNGNFVLNRNKNTMTEPRTRDLRNCRKSPAQGGYTRGELNTIARDLGIDPTRYGKKDDLCSEIMRLTYREGGRVATPRERKWTNPELAEQLTRLANYYVTKGEQYRAGAFQQAAAIISGLGIPITDTTQLQGIRGIGPGVIDRISELLIRGRLSELAEVDALTERERVVAELATVFGIGPATAGKLADQGVTGLDDLKVKVNAGQIQLTETQLMGLQYYDDFKQRLSRIEVKTVGDYILSLIHLLHPDNVAEVVGSYRRGKETSGDVDILMSNRQNINMLEQVIGYLNQVGLIRHIISLGPVKFQGTYRQGYPNDTGYMRKFDVRFVPIESWVPALLHSTGSDNSNIRLRRKAIELGLLLSEHGLFMVDPITKEPGARVHVTSEEDVFRELGLDYVPPEERN